MGPRSEVSEENRRLRGTVRDLVALSMLPAVWIGLDRDRIAASLADALLNALSLDLIYVRLAGPGGQLVVEVARGRNRGPMSVDVIRKALEPMMASDHPVASSTIPEVFGEKPLRISLTRFGTADDQGVLLSGSCDPHFPLDRDLALLGVSANQTAIVLQRRRAEQHAQEQQEWLRVTLASIGDAVIATDQEGCITYANGVAEQLTGWASDEAHGKPLDAVFAIRDETTRQPVENPVQRVLREGVVVGLANHTVLVARDGTERPIDDSAAPIRDRTGRMLGAVLVFRDVTEQRKLERQRNARLAVTSVLSEAASVDQAISGVLQAICENLGWDAGLFWGVDAGRHVLTCRASWGQPGSFLSEFVADSRSRTFAAGEGLPGRVWATRAPAWILDVRREANFSRRASATRLGVHSALGCPVAVPPHTHGVIEFFTKRLHEPDADVLEVMATVCGAIGQFIERKTAEEEVRRSEQELADFFENATVGLHWVGPDGTILRANRAELEMLGFAREEYVGHPINEFHTDESVIQDILSRLKAGEKLADYPARLRCKNGSIKDVLIDSSVMWRDGRFIHTRCFTRDVTDRKQAEALARAQDLRNRTILESIGDGFCALDREWRFTYVNRQAELLLGRSRNELLGRNHWEEYPATVGTELESSYHRAVAENVTVTLEHYYPPHDRWYDVHAYPSADGLSVYFQDVTARKRAHLALRESAQRLRQLADAMPQIVWTAGPDGNIDFLNRRWSDLTGLEHTVGNDAWKPVLHPDEARAAGKRWAACVRSGEPFEMELRLLDRQMNYRWHLVRTVPARGPDGSVVRWFGTSTDVHEQKRAQEASRFLADASAELASVVDYENTLQKLANLAVPYFADWAAVDLAGDDGSLKRLAVAHQNPSKVAIVEQLMREFPPDPSSPVGIHAVLRSGRPELVSDISDAMLVQQARADRELELMRSLQLKSYICVPLVVSGKTLGLLTFATAESQRAYTTADLAVATDLAQRAAVAVENNQLYQALRDADRRKDEFLATLAHELRNPLAPVRNALQILKMPHVDAATIERSREMMERQVQHLVRLVDDLLDVSRVMRGKIELRRERVELSTVVAHAVEMVQPLLDARGHVLEVHVSPESLLLDVDPVRLAQVAGNLLTNAAKYTEPRGRIRVTTERDGDMAVLRIRDNGIGIPAPMLPRVFELFVQVDHASSRTQGGLGIGLTLVKNLVEMHNGIVHAHSEGPGRGAEFTVKLPLFRCTSEAPAATPSSPTAQPPNRSGKRFLVVDDNQDAADSLATLLRLSGHEVRVAYSGMAALEITRTFTPHVVLLDLGMPGLDGYEVARRIRQTRGLEKIVLAALTGWGQKEDRRRTAEAGFDHHLVKPPQPDVIASLFGN